MALADGRLRLSWVSTATQSPPRRLRPRELGDSHRERFVYISHEHKDHLDLAFLDSLRCRDFTVVIPDFRRDYLVSAFADYRCKDVVACGDETRLRFPGAASSSTSTIQS